MNYRHAFHAGNFADVLKHVLLALMIDYLKRKDAAFRYIDTHAGSGLYDLSSDEAQRGGEWRDGIARLTPDRLAAFPESSLLKPYQEALAFAATRGGTHAYPGSPLIAQALMRPVDKALLCETQDSVRAELNAALGRDKRIKCFDQDGYMGLNAFTPPVERRGLVLIDPPFERRDEFERLYDVVVTAWRKWPSGIYMIWLPVKDAALMRQFRQALVDAGVRRMLEIGLDVGSAPQGLAAVSQIIVNPPFTLEDDAHHLLPFLLDCLRRGEGARFWIEWLSGE